MGVEVKGKPVRSPRILYLKWLCLHF